MGVSEFKSAEKKRSPTINVGSLTKTHFPGVKGYSSSLPGSAKKEDFSSNTALNVSGWECSKEYERVLKTIGRNRKTFISIFDDLKKTNVPITKVKVQEVIGGILETDGIILTPEKWPYLVKFAEKDGMVDYKFMLEVFKERLYLLSAHPKVNIVSP